MKKENTKKEKVAPEPHFVLAVELFFAFHKHHFRDEDGFMLAPNWEGGKRGMEMKGLKLLLTTLRQISEGKNIEWSADQIKIDFNKFLEKAYSNTFLRKNFLCCMLNRYKFDILSSAYNPALAKKIREVWYYNFPDYTVDVEKDAAASEVIVGFLKQQFVLASMNFTETSMLASMRVIIDFIKADDFWNKKSLKSISNNLQEFVNKIKASKNGSTTTKQNSGGQKPFSTSDSKIAALKQWGVKAAKSRTEQKTD